MHPCKIIFSAAGQEQPADGVEGTCRITGEPGRGIPFEKWVKDTFTNHSDLYPGNIISHEAMFCFEEKSELIQAMTGRDKPQKFRTYSHIVDHDGVWHCVTKADKKRIVEMIVTGAKLVCLTDSGQKHVLFKHRPGFWQLDDLHVQPNIEDFSYLHSSMLDLLELGFSQTEILSGNYSHARVLRCGMKAWQTAESKIKDRRGEPIFDLAAWLMYGKMEV